MFFAPFSYDCDEFTKKFYELNFGVQDFQPLDVKQRIPKPPKQVRFMPPFPTKVVTRWIAGSSPL